MGDLMGEIINVKKIVEDKKVSLKEEVNKLKKNNIFPKLAIILANDNEASRIYVNKKRMLCEELGILEEEYIYDENVTTEEILTVLDKLNCDKTVNGILVQLPLFKHLDETKILEKIDSTKDADGLHPLNIGKTYIGNEQIVACTPKGVMTVIDSVCNDISGKNAVVVGRSILVGKPMAALLLNRDATVTICHSKTKKLEEYTKNADILVVAVGHPKLITKDMVKKDSIVIDVGINRIDKKIVGDVDTEEVVKIAKYVTPVPGGIGLTTVLSLIDNVINSAKSSK